MKAKLLTLFAFSLIHSALLSQSNISTHEKREIIKNFEQEGQGTIVLGSFERSSYYQEKYSKSMTFLLNINAMDYDGLKYGWKAGVSYDEYFSLAYFHSRDFRSSESSWQDSRVGGIEADVQIPILRLFQIGVATRWANLKSGYLETGGHFIYSGKFGIKLGRSLKVFAEYGKGDDHDFRAAGLSWNLY